MRSCCYVGQTSDKLCGRQEQPFVNRVCMKFEYITKVPYYWLYMAVTGSMWRLPEGYIVWLSLMRVTDWLNTLTWLKHNLECSPPQSCGGGTLIDTKCFYSGKIFHANKWQNELAILSLQKCMLTALDRALAVYCAHSTIDTHCTARNLKKIPAEKNYWVWSSTSNAEAGQGNGEPYNITDGDFVVGNITECS